MIYKYRRQYKIMPDFNVTVENAPSKVAFDGVIRLNGSSNCITIPKTTEILGFTLGVRVRVILEKIEGDD